MYSGVSLVPKWWLPPPYKSDDNDLELGERNNLGLRPGNVRNDFGNIRYVLGNLRLTVFGYVRVVYGNPGTLGIEISRLFLVSGSHSVKHLVICILCVMDGLSCLTLCRGTKGSEMMF